MPGELKTLKCKPIGPRAVKKYSKVPKYRRVSIRKDGGFVVTAGPLKGKRCSIRNIGQDRARYSAKKVSNEHRHQGDMRRGKTRASRWI